MVIPELKNSKYISGPATYVVNPGDDSTINCDTTNGAITIVLPNILNSGIRPSGKRFYINDYAGTAATNNIIIETFGGNTINSGTSIVMATNSESAECLIVSNTEWLGNLSGDNPSGSGLQFANNGLSVSLGTTVQLGGALIKSSSIDRAGFDLSIIDTVTNSTLLKQFDGAYNTIIGGLPGGNTYSPFQPSNINIFGASNVFDSSFGQAGGIVVIGSAHTFSGSTTDTWIFGDYGDVTDGFLINSFGRQNDFTSSTNILNFGNSNVVTSSANVAIIGFSNLVSSVTDKILIGQNSNYLSIDSNGSVGIGVISPTAQLHIKAANSFSSVFQIQNSIATGNIFETDGSGYTMIAAATIGAISPLTSLYAILNFSNTSGQSQISKYGDDLYLSNKQAQGLNKEDLLIYNNGDSKIRSNLYVGNTIDSSSRLYIVGVDATSAHYAIKSNSSSLANLFSVRNDGEISGGTANSEFSFGNTAFSHISSNNGSFTIGAPLQDSNFRFVINGANYQSIAFQSVYATTPIIGNGASGTSLQVFTTASGNNFTWLSPYNVGINFNGVYYSPTATLDVLGNTSDVSEYALKIKDSTLNNLFSVRNDGLISAPKLPTSSAGLSAGDIWVDTASSNVLKQV